MLYDMYLIKLENVFKNSLKERFVLTKEFIWTQINLNSWTDCVFQMEERLYWVNTGKQ